MTERDPRIEAAAKKLTEDYFPNHGFTMEESLGYVKRLGDHEHDVQLFAGSWPFNQVRLSIRVDGATIGTNCKTEQDVEHLERLLAGAPVDYDDVMYVDEGELQE